MTGDDSLKANLGSIFALFFIIANVGSFFYNFFLLLKCGFFRYKFRGYVALSFNGTSASFT